MNKLFTARLAYAGIWLFGLLYALLCEFGCLPTAYINLDVEKQYACDLICITAALGGTFLALRLLVFEKVKREITERPATILKWNFVRLAIQAAAVFTNLFFYYALTSTNTAKYGMLIAVIGLMFCMPQSVPVSEKNK